MSENSKIEWTHHTFNPWRGCTKVSAGCANCYAETLSKRNPKTLGIWGDDGTRVIAAESYWRQPIAWNRKAEKAGERHRVFCASLADVFEDRPELHEPRKRLIELFYVTPHLDWLLLTKRPENALRLLYEDGLYAHPNPTLPCPQPNVWIGTSVENQQAADERIPHLLNTPAAVRFLSCEPLLGPLNLSAYFGGPYVALPGDVIEPNYNFGVHWVIVGGESGHGARPMAIHWARDIVQQCGKANIPVFMKQLGSKPMALGGSWPDDLHVVDVKLNSKKGGDMAEWPADLRVRQMPERSE